MYGLHSILYYVKMPILIVNIHILYILQLNMQITLEIGRENCVLTQLIYHLARFQEVTGSNFGPHRSLFTSFQCSFF